ncbi:MAG: hypothetical protein AB7P02_11690 [Alphaproteobacteria bacterium]
MSIRSLAFAALAAACVAAVPVAAWETNVTLRLTFQNSTGGTVQIKGKEYGDGANDDSPSSLAARSAYDVPPFSMRINGMVPTRQYMATIFQNGWGACVAIVDVNSNSCTSRLRDHPGTACDAATSWANTSCSAAIKIGN